MIDNEGGELSNQLQEFWRGAAQPDVGRAVELLRRQFDSRRAFIDRMAAVTGRDISLDDSLIYKWERGRVSPTAYYRSMLNELCAAQVNTMTPQSRREFLHKLAVVSGGVFSFSLPLIPQRPLPPESGSRDTASETLSFDQELVGWSLANHERPLDGATLNSFATLTRVYIQQMHIMPPRTLLPQVRSHLAALGKYRYASGPLKRDLLALAAETLALIGRLSFSVGNYGDALGCYKSGENMAAESGHTWLRAYILGQTSHLHSSFWQTGPGSRVALSVLDTAIAYCGQSAPPLVRAWLAVRRAEEHSAAGDTVAMERDLDLADRILAGTQHPKDDWGFFMHWEGVSEARLAGYRGNCQRMLGRAAEAVEIIEKAVGSVPESLESVRSTMLADLASAHARQQEPEQACIVIGKALELTAQNGLLPHLQRLIGVRRELVGCDQISSVKELDERLQHAWGLRP